MSLSLTEEDNPPLEIKVGEPLTRTITLRAQGLGFEQLPELTMAKPEGAEIYPDKPDTRTRDDGLWLYGERTRKFAVVPTRSGKLILPEVEVQWWNVAQDRAEKAILPAREIKVVAASAGAGTTPGKEAVQPAEDTDRNAENPPSIIYPSTDGATEPAFWRALSLVLAIAWLVTIALWWRSRRMTSIVRAESGLAEQPRGRSAFMRACAMGDLVGAERALVAWARSERPAVRNLGELISAIESDEQHVVLEELLRMRYAGVNSDGLGARLSRSFRSGIVWGDRVPARVAVPALPPLYPDN
jgi:hypothetical protein